MLKKFFGRINILISLEDIINGDENVIPNSVSYFKLLELGRDYDKLVKRKIFDNKFSSSMELKPYETSISSVKIGSNDIESNKVYSVNRVVKCDFFKKYTVCDFQQDSKCNHNHNQKYYSCSYFKIFKGNCVNFLLYFVSCFLDDFLRNIHDDNFK